MQIKNRWTGAVLFEGNFNTVRACVSAAVLAGANLAGADLAGAYLGGANLAGADLAGAYLARVDLAGANLAGANLARVDLARVDLAGADLAGAKIRNGITLAGRPLRRAVRNDGYEFFLWPTDAGHFVQAGCRWFTFDEAWAHWCGPNAKRLNTPLGDESQDILVMFSLALDRVEGGKS